MNKKEKIESCVKEILETLGLDLTDDSIQDTPKRVAKMYVDEIFNGLFEQPPKMTVQENKFNYDQMLIETNIKVHSMCEHHLVPIIGYAHIAYIPKNRVLGLSKFNRVVDYFARRPQVQEKLTNNILQFLTERLETEDVAVVIDAVHMCVKLRGIKDQDSVTRTSAISGVFRLGEPREEFFSTISKLGKQP
jgi:GTP cyclohydrolase I